MRAWWRGWSARTLVQALLLGCVLLLIWGGIWLQVQQERTVTERAAIKETSNLALAFEENIIRSIAAIDQVLLIVRDLYARDPGRFDLAGWVHDRPFINDQTFQLSLIDASGMLVQSNLAGTRGPVDLSDREHFRVHVGTGADALFISKPLLGRVSNRYSVQFTRRVVGLDGEFLGVVVASLDPSYLARFYESLQIGDGFVMLVGLDGYIRAGRPVPGLIGRQLTNSTLLERASLAGSGYYQLAVAEMTERPAIVSYRRLAEYPLVVMVGYGSEEVFAPYRQHRFQYVAAGIGLSALVLCIGIILAIHRRRLAGYQDRLTATLENMSQGIIMVDRDRRVGVINRRVRDLLGLPPELMRGDTGFDAIIRWQEAQGEFASTPNPSASMVDPLEAGVPVFEQERPNGTVLEVRTTLLPNGGAVRTYTDITEQKCNEQEIAAARDAAEEAGRARSRLLAVMSHEIRTPLNGIIGAAGLLLDHRLEAEELRYVQIIRQSGDHLLRLISDILDFTRLDASCMELEEAPFDLRTTLTGTLDMLAAAAHAKGLDLTLALAEDTPQCAVGDAGRLRQVLFNLIGNAIKFTERGSVHVTVSCKRDASRDVRLVVEVDDTGIGIPHDALPRLFQEFGQVDGSISRRFGGSGLGLVISRQLIQRMGGSLIVKSTPGVGSTFAFEVMLKDAPVDDPGIAVATSAPCATRHRLHVLLVEDNTTNRLVASRMLERMGYRVDTVADGAAAVQAVRAVPYELVLMDVMMPGMDGLTATRLIRSEPARNGCTRIIGLTASAEPGNEVACRRAGMDGFVSKPVTAERLATAIEAVTTPVSPLLDADVLDQLADDIGADGVADVTRLFLSEAPRTTERLEQAINCRGHKLLREVHTLASTARSVGLLRLGNAAAEIEQTLASEEPAAEHLSDLLDLMHESVTRLAEWATSRMMTELSVT